MTDLRDEIGKIIASEHCDEWTEYEALATADQILDIPAIREALETHAMVTAMEGWGRSTAPCKGPDQRP